jgi:hypothetical protein
MSLLYQKLFKNKFSILQKTTFYLILELLITNKYINNELKKTYNFQQKNVVDMRLEFFRIRTCGVGSDKITKPVDY